MTGVIGELNGGRVFDQTFHFAPGSPQVSAGFKAAVAAITAAGGPAVVIAAPELVAHRVVTGPNKLVAKVFFGTSTTITNSITIGPGTVLFGPDLSVTHFVPATTTNIDTNTQTETFFENDFQATVTHFATYEIDGTVQSIGVVYAAVQPAGFDMGSHFLGELAGEANFGAGGGGESLGPFAFAPDEPKPDIPAALLAYADGPAPSDVAGRYHSWAMPMACERMTMRKGPSPATTARPAGLPAASASASRPA
jgi:hypothetical protein